MPIKKSPHTVAATAGIASDTTYGAVAPPLYLSSTFAFDGFGRAGAYEYTRSGHPGRDRLANTLAELEGGAGAVVVASGMAALDLVLAKLRRDELILAPHDCYGGIYRLLTARKARQEFDVIFVDQTDCEALNKAFKNYPSLVLVETPSNPMMRVVNIRALSARAKAVEAKLVVDNTFLSPALQNPIALGADFVIHSTTKYINGHSDIVGGAVIAADKADAESLANWANITGVAGAPFDTHMTLRGLRTLYPRIECQQETAASLATFLSDQPAVAAVYYPGLETHPGHAVAKSQQAGFGAMLSFELDGDIATVRRFVSKLSLFTLAESLGGVESLIAHPATMTHACMDADARRAAGIGDMLLRLSVGLEGKADLMEDLKQAFESRDRRH
jgi:cystathionine gamma-synthase